MAAAKQVEVVVSVDDDHMAQVSQVAARLRKLGLNQPEVQPAIGTISGVVPEDRIGELRKVAGVAAVEKSREYQLPDPGSDVQ